MSTFEEEMEAWRAYEAEKERLANLKDAPGGKVYMAHYGQCEYNCLQELILELRHERDSRSWRSLFLVDIVKYNVRFRDCLRNTGIEGVMEMMTEECPSLATEEEELGKLRQWWKERMDEHIADYDIQCYPRDAQLKLCGSMFDGLEDIERQVEMAAIDRYIWNDDCAYPRKEYKQNPNGLHVGCLWQSYPTFDSSDSSDGRSYDNYIVRSHPITASDMKQLYDVKSETNACRVHEFVPEDLLPIVYHDGNNKYILVATKKNELIRKGRST